MTRSGAARLGERVRAELERLPPARLGHLRAHVRRELTEISNTLEDDGDSDPHDDVDLRANALGLAAMQTMLGTLHWIPELGAVLDAVEAMRARYSIHDAHFTTWSCVDLQIGPAQATVATLTLELASTLGLTPEVRRAVQAHARGRLGLFRIVDLQPPRVGISPIHHLRELVTEQDLAVQLFEPFAGDRGELILARCTPLPPSSAERRGVSHGVFAMPYVLLTRDDAEWMGYFEREAAAMEVRLDADGYERIMRGGGNERRWLDFVVDGGVGMRDGHAFELRGTPDRPEPRRYATGGGPRDAFEIPPGASPRARSKLLSAKIARSFGALSQRESSDDRAATIVHLKALRARGADVQLCAPLLMPLSLYEGSPAGGSPWVDLLLADGSLDADAREYVLAAKDARTSIFEVLEVQDGERWHLRDVFDGREFLVHERARSTGATRTLMLARIVRYREIDVLEGMLPHVAPPSLRAALVERIQATCPVPAAPAPRARGWAYPAMLAWFEVLAEA